MQTSKRLSVGLIAFALTIAAATFAAPVTAQDKAPEKQTTVDLNVRGDVIRVDPDAKKIVIKTTDGTELDFIYTDETKVTGAQEGPAGLATMAGTDVTIHFRQDGDARLATKIEVNSRG